uniref:Uncharacterized protein n=1 Tax=Salarias fasciatus TaxID=181472 RepID=A0A672FAT9_SALFA
GGGQRVEDRAEVGGQRVEDRLHVLHLFSQSPGPSRTKINPAEHVVPPGVLQRLRICSTENPDRLDQVSRRLILREDRLFGQTSSVQEEDQLHRDLRVLEDLLWTAVQNTFSSSVDQQEALRSAVTAIQQQEEQDRRWAELQGLRGPGGRVPAWRPLRLLRTHDLLLEDLVEARLKDQEVADRTVCVLQVCALGRRVKDDLLTAARTVAPCYPAHLDILTLFLRLYHRRFSRHLEHLASSLEASPLSGSCPQRTTSCLGPLLGDERLKVLEDRYLSSSEVPETVRLKLWLDNLLSREQQAWRTGRDPEVLDGYRFSPLAADAIQVSHWSRSVSGPGQSLVQVSRWSRSLCCPRVSRRLSLVERVLCPVSCPDVCPAPALESVHRDINPGHRLTRVGE